MGPPLFTRQVSNLLVAHLFYTLVSVFRRVTAYKLGDFLVENRECSSWTIKSYDFSGRRNWPTLSIV